MSLNKTLLNSKGSLFLLTVAAVTALGLPGHLLAQGSEITQEEEEVEEVIVTGTRIRVPGLVSSSPIYSVGADEIGRQQEPEVEKILRILPITLPGDNQNVNNGTGGAATVDLRGLGPERSVSLMNGLRLTPYNWNGFVDVSSVPTALIERIDILTGGASTVYGSDAIAGAINFVMKDDFEGVDIRYNNSSYSAVEAVSGFKGETESLSVTLGSNLVDDRGNVVLHLNTTTRQPVLLGARPFGRLGINTAPDDSDLPEDEWTNAGLASYDSGAGNVPPADAGCAGEGASDFTLGSGSTTAIPTSVQIVGGGTFGQFRNDGTIGTRCARFNFNPYNYFQTPQKKYGGMAIGHFSLTDNVEVYAQVGFNHITVVQQVAPSGTFGSTFFVPIDNPFLSDQARAAIIQESTRTGLLVSDPDVAGYNHRDNNDNDVLDSGDYVNMVLRRRTLEFGFRTEEYESDYFQLVSGVRGSFREDYDYNISYQYGESNRATIRAGYTNLTNIANALDVGGTAENPTCNGNDASCVPLNLFGGLGTITPEAAAYSQAVAIQQHKYTQEIITGSVGGVVRQLTIPSADTGLAFNVGFERRKETGKLEPDECLKLAPASCQGGAGGNLLPISGGFEVDEFFGEFILPLVENKPGASSLHLEGGYRFSDYNTVGKHDTWKIGVNWQPIDSLRLRFMRQQAIRAPNIDELFAPVVTGLDNAQQDPCSSANANISADLRALCITTGQTATQVGGVDDVISNQVQILQGSNPAATINPETADTTTIGLVWAPSFSGPVNNVVLSLDYYDINIKDIIGEFSAQEILDACYENSNMAECAKINRVGGSLTLPGAGIDLFTDNLQYLRARGLEFSYSFDVDLNTAGTLRFAGTLNKYLTHESRSSDVTPVLRCNGHIATDCDGVFSTRWINRTTWDFRGLSLSLQWRHLGKLTVPDRERGDVFQPFRTIKAYDYFDLYGSYSFWQERLSISLGIENLTGNAPPIVGQDIGSTSYNFGNTLPSHYDVFGRTYSLSLGFRF